MKSMMKPIVNKCNWWGNYEKIQGLNRASIECIFANFHILNLAFGLSRERIMRVLACSRMNVTPWVFRGRSRLNFHFKLSLTNAHDRYYHAHWQTRSYKTQHLTDWLRDWITAVQTRKTRQTSVTTKPQNTSLLIARATWTCSSYTIKQATCTLGALHKLWIPSLSCTSLSLLAELALISFVLYIPQSSHHWS